MDYLNFLQENSTFENLTEQASEQKDLVNQLKEQYLQGAGEAILPAVDLLRRGVNAVQKIGSTVSNVIEKGQEVMAKGEEVLAKGTELVKSTPQVVENVDVSGEVRGIGSRIANRMRVSEFEQDPEDLSVNQENLSAFERVQTLFRGGSQEAEGVAQKVSSMAEGVAQKVSGLGENLAEGVAQKVANVGEKVAGEVGEVGEVGENVASKVATPLAEGIGEAVGEGIGAIASEAIPIVGEVAGLALGIYDVVKGLTERKPLEQVQAVPAFMSGL
jgi:hypothetical protein